ncbi:MAG: MATE family efflux transporter [Candidatus Pelagibacter sp.]|nr:MATE family efflux transporter [Candidatus Pelagibacter sp.]
MPTLRYPANISRSYLLKLSFPIFFSNLAVPLVGVIDTALMGHLANESYLVATSLASSTILMIFWSFGFLRMGTVGLVSQSLGKGDYHEIVNIVVRNLILALLVSILIIFLYLPIIYGIDFFFNTSDNIFQLIKKYIFIRVFSAPAELTLYVLVGLFLGLQKTLIASMITISYSLLNIFLSIVLVINFNLNISGVALGTLISSYVATFLVLVWTYFFFKKRFQIIAKLKKSIFNIKKITKLVTICSNIFIRTIFLTFAFLWINYLSSKIGESYIAINTILLQLVTISSFFLDAFAYSTEGVIGYAVGKKSEKTFLNTVTNSIQLSFFTGIIIGVIYIFFSKEIVNLITNLDVIRLNTYEYIFWLVLIPPIASICYQLDGIFIGATETKSMRNCMIISVLTYIFISLIFLDAFDNHGIWISLIILMILRSITLYFCFGNIMKKF